MLKLIFLPLILILTIAGCASRSVLADAKEVKVSRDEPSSKCKEIGKLTGNASSTKGTQEEALADLKKEAANKGANYVVVKQYSTYGTAVTGIGYECP